MHTLYLAEALARLGAEVTVWSLARAGGDRGGFFRDVDPAVTVRLVEFTDHAGDTVTDRIVRSIEVLGRAFTPGDYDIVHAQDCISANAVGVCIRTIHHLDQFTTPGARGMPREGDRRAVRSDLRVRRRGGRGTCRLGVSTRW